MALRARMKGGFLLDSSLCAASNKKPVPHMIGKRYISVLSIVSMKFIERGVESTPLSINFIARLSNALMSFDIKLLFLLKTLERSPNLVKQDRFRVELGERIFTKFSKNLL